MEAQAMDMLGTILARRTTRKFLAKEVPDDVILRLMQMAMFAPTRLGRRPWEFIVMRKPEVKARVASALRLEADYAGAPVYVAVLGDKEATDSWDLDGGAAAENLLIAATSMGLGTAWIASPVNPLWDRLDALLTEVTHKPPAMGLVAILALGYPAEAEPAHTADEVYEQHRVHFETWGATRGK